MVALGVFCRFIPRRPRYYRPMGLNRKNGRGRRDLVGRAIEVPGRAAFALARGLFRIGDYQFDEGIEDGLVETQVDTADFALMAEGLILSHRSLGNDRSYALEIHGDGEIFFLLRKARDEESPGDFLPEAGELRRRVLECSGGLPLLPRGETEFRRLVRRVYLDGDEVATLAFDESRERGETQGRLRVEAVEAPSSRLGEIERLLDLVAERMRQALEPVLFEEAAEPVLESLRLPPERPIVADDFLGVSVILASLRFAEKGIGLLADAEGNIEPDTVKLCREAFVRARLALELGSGLVDEKFCRSYAKGLRRVVSLVGAIGTVDGCRSRFLGKDSAAPKGGAAFAERLHRLRGRAAEDLRRHLGGERYRRFVASFRELALAMTEAVPGDRRVALAAPRVMGRLYDELLENFRAAGLESATARDLREALTAALRTVFALELLSGALGRGALPCAKRLSRSIEALSRFGSALSSADMARSWLSASSGPKVDAVAAAFLAKNQAIAARIMEDRVGLLALVSKTSFRRDFAFSSYGLD